MVTAKYVLVTPAHNEESLIGNTIESVAAQTVRPARWVIIDDGSVDQTARIVLDYAKHHSFIRLLSIVRDPRSRGFESKVNAVRLGLDQVKDLDYDFLGNLDADITLFPDYYERVLATFERHSRLGIAGGMISELQQGVFKSLKYNLGSVAGAVQTFRRRCYEDIGGYLAVAGGIDAVAEVMARMRGWEVRSLPELNACHHRRTGTKMQSVVRSRFVGGRQEYALGSHPLFHVGKCFDRLRERPYLVSGCLLMAGYLWAWAIHEPRPVSDDFVTYMRGEQKQRMCSPLEELGLSHRRAPHQT